VIELHVTFPDMKSAEALARKALEARLAACANIVPNVRSLYWWKGKIEDETEVFAIFKTSHGQADALAAFIAKHHPYETPAIIRHDKVSANADYEAWVEAETSGEQKR
jgi:periplasmic divalent cation tolerance protein